MIDCYDAVDKPPPAEILHAPAILAYVAGTSYVNYAEYARARPDLEREGKIITVTLTSNARARMYDIEPGGGTNGGISTFMRVADRSHGKPILYTFASNGQAMMDAARGFGFERGRDYFYLSSHATSKQHICSPTECGYPQADGTQFLFGPNYDRSILQDYFFSTVAADPHNYLWYDRTVRDLGALGKISERELVMVYDQLRPHEAKHPVAIRSLRDQANALAHRITVVVERTGGDWKAWHRYWRHEALLARGRGERLF